MTGPTDPGDGPRPDDRADGPDPGPGPADPGIDRTRAGGTGPDVPGDGVAGPVRTPAAHASRRRGPWRVVVLGCVVAVAVVVFGGYLWVRSEADPSGPQGAQVIVTVPVGAGADTTGSLLAERGVVTDALAFRVWSWFNGLPGLEAGTYAFRANSSFGEVRTVLSGGPNVFPLVNPPGFTVAELAERAGQLPGHDASSFERTATSGVVRSPWQPTGVTSLEGLLATGTYMVVPGETDRQILEAMVDRFDAQAARIGLAAGSAALGYSPYQVVTVAAIVEKEGVLEANMGPVARVVYNRLARSMPLQMNSTVLYALGQDGGTVTPADLRLQTPYNTYLNEGLPPTPTCFPSEQALDAALHPPAGAWLYFVVVRQDGTEAFSDTYAGQLANEALANQRGVG